MDTKANRPHEEGGTWSGGPTDESNAPNWPANLTTPELKKLIGKLEAGVTSACELPDAYSAYDDLITAAAVARRTLKVRLARERVADAQKSLRDTGWPA